MKYWLNPDDPDFDDKAAAIGKLYVSPPEKATVLCLDEKPGIQALRRTHPQRRMRRSKPVRVEFEYECKGTRNLFGAFNVKTGHVLRVGDRGPLDRLGDEFLEPALAPLSSGPDRYHHRQHQHPDGGRRERLAGASSPCPLRLHPQARQLAESNRELVRLRRQLQNERRVIRGEHVRLPLRAARFEQLHHALRVPS